jgi:hypothetical protein
MAAATIDYMGMMKGLPEGAWVAISERDRKVVSYAADLQIAINMARDRGENDPLIVRVPEQSSVLFL